MVFDSTPTAAPGAPAIKPDKSTAITSICVHPEDSTVVYAAIGSQPAAWVTPTVAVGGRLFYSSDSGGSFAPRSDGNLDITVDGVTLPHVKKAVNAVCTDPAKPLDVYIGTDHGVFYSPDEGVTWSDFGQNLPRTAIYDLQYHAGTKLLRAATYGEVFGNGHWTRH